MLETLPTLVCGESDYMTLPSGNDNDSSRLGLLPVVSSPLLASRARLFAPVLLSLHFISLRSSILLSSMEWNVHDEIDNK